MSLILEALRKSEQQRRLGEVPTLDSESAWAARRWHGTPARGARWPWLAAIAVLALAGGAGWWFLGPRGDAATDAAGESAAAAATPAPPPTTPAPIAPPLSQAAAPAGVDTPDALPPPSRRPIAPPAPLPIAPAPIAPSTVAAPTPDAPTPAVDGEYPEVAAPPQPPVPPAAPPLPTATEQALPPPVDAAPPMAAAPQPAAATPPPAADSSGDVPLVYALPLATRQALPALRLSMHVWNADPARRFVIIGETRAAEGETAGTDLTVVEIRREGVVLEFKGTRFLLPRGGW